MNFSLIHAASPKNSQRDEQEKNHSAIVAQDEQYVKYETNIVLDRETDLEWFAGPEKEMGWYEAESWISSLDVDGRGWRMPYLKELKTILKNGKETKNILSLLKTSGWFVWYEESSIDLFPLIDVKSNEKGSGFLTNHARVFAVRSKK